MAALVPTIKDKEFVNWLKGALALLFVKQGLDDFVTDELTDFQKDLLASIFRNKALPTGTVCNSCTTENVLDCPTQNFCSKGRRCHLHDATNPNKKSNQPCPINLCRDIRDGIRREHRYNGPSWKNTKADMWCTDAFEIAKCFMPPDGYFAVTTLADTDFNGILSVIINNKRFQNKMAAQLNQPNNICYEARDVGRMIRHSADFTLTDMELKRYIDILKKLLSDPKYLAIDQKAQDAVDKLNQLEANTLSIRTEDITIVIDDAIRKSVKSQGDIAIQAVSKEKDTTLEEIKCESLQLLNDVKSSVANVQTVTAESLDIIIAEKVSAIDAIRMIAEKEKHELKTIGSSERALLQEELKKGKDRQQRSTGLVGSFRKRRLCKRSLSPQHLTKVQVIDTSLREEVEQNMKEDLIKFYRRYHCNIPVSPLVEEHDVPLTDFYVQPPLSSVDVQRKYGGQYREFPKKTPIQSYCDVFLHGDGELYKDVYITAKAGVGKTSFAKKICMTWCQAHRPFETLEQKFKPEDINLMKTIDFLFMVSLRDVDISLCDLDDMVESSLLHSLARSSRYSRRHLEDILNERTCLIVLDGLDEWTHPLKCSRGGNDVHAIPHIRARERCTAMTTTRPWKLDVVRLGTSDIDRHVEINELNEPSSKELIRNAVSVLNRQRSQDQSHTAEGFESATSTLKLDNLRYIPYILLQMICLWFDGKSIGRTKCEIYTNIITLTLSRGLNKLERKSLQPRRSRNISSISEIPPCSQLNELCKSYYDVLMNLGKLAFENLFSSKAKICLVFDRSEVLGIISNDILSFCLEIGFLSQTKDYGSVSERRSTLSFQHKSIQEYFAALYIQSCYDNQDIQQSIRKVCNTLPAILEMQDIFIFLAGLNYVACEQIFHIFEDTSSADETIKYFRNSYTIGRMVVPRLLEYWNIIKSWQCMLIDSVQEIINNNGKSNTSLYIEDIIIDSTITLDTCAILKILSENNNDKIKSMSITDCHSTDELTQKLTTLDLQNMHLLQRLFIQAVPKEQDLTRLLSGSAHTLSCLLLEFLVFKNNLLFSRITEMSSETMGILLSMNNLQVICLGYIRLQHADIERLFKYLNTRKTMEVIRLLFIVCKDHNDQCNGFCLDLSQNKNLMTLNLSNLPVSTLHVDSSSLENCVVGQLQPAVQLSLVQCLPDASNLIIVSFIRLQSVQADIIVDTLLKLPKLEYIIIEFTDFGDTRLTLPPQMIHLEIVWLHEVTMTSTSLRRLIDSVDVLPQQVMVDLRACTVKPETDYRQVKETIRSSPNYQVVFDGLNKSGLVQFQFQTRKHKTVCGVLSHV